MLDQMQVSSPSLSIVVSTSTPRLLALLNHPEFQSGLMDGQNEFLGSYEPVPMTEEEMFEAVEMDVGREVTERCQKISEMMGWEPASYLYNLGFVIGLIDKGLTYAQ